MTLIHCLGIGALVGLDAWLPSEPFDYAWGPFGCNQLRCGSCKQPVRARPDTIGAVLEAVVRLPSADRARALDDLRDVSAAARTAIERWLDKNPSIRP